MWKIAQCAIQGRSHIKNNIPCQDKTFALVRNGVYVTALADGAGSAELSHLGAGRVTEFVCHELSENFDRFFDSEDGVSVKQELMSKIIISIDEVARKYQSDIKKFASTLLFVAVKDDRFIIAHLGDGVIGYVKNDILKVASEPYNGEFANTTVFTTSKNATFFLKLIKGTLENISGFVLMSDGTAEALYSKAKKQLSNGVKKVIDLCRHANLEYVEKMLDYSFCNTIRQVTADDCSICVMSCVNSQFREYFQLDIKDKAKLLKIKFGVSLKRQVERYDKILLYLSEDKTLKSVSKYIHLKPKYTKKYIDRLLELDFIEKSDGKYHSILDFCQVN